MNKNILLAISGILLIACIAEGYLITKERNEKIVLGAQLVKAAQMQKAPARPRPSFLTKGQKFSDSPLFSKAYLIAPVTGTLSQDAQKALFGWTVTSKNNVDGTTMVTLTPKDADDVQQTFTLKTGYKLYFIEANPGDEPSGTDNNRADDMGVLVDDKGLVQ